MDPVPADLGRHYPTDYYDVPQTEAELAETATRLQQWTLDTVLAHKPGGRLLEIGPAYGLFAYLAKRAGFDVTGIEMDARCCAFLRGTVGINVVESNDPAAAMATLPGFDVIVLWQVIEHMPDPWRVLAAAAARLNPGGVIILDTPNPAAFQFGVLGHRWAHLDAPRHVLLIPVEVMTAQMARNGLEPVLLTASDFSANGFNGFGWAFSFKNTFGDNIFGRTAHLFGRVVGKLLIPIERTGWRGSTYTAVFAKRSVA
jgi:2-polyprenyl-3-methyl-5-hydroxy-6-metoxy-1,4-benzoquinol methylase